MGYRNIADIGKERIRRVIERMQSPDEDSDDEDSPQLALNLEEAEDGRADVLQDLGFKVFKLAPSTFRRWEPPAEADDLEQQLSYFDAGLKDAVDVQHVLYEVLLKQGFSLNSAIETLSLDGNTVYQVTQPPEEASGLIECYVCLDDRITTATLDALPLEEETLFICQDAALDDAQKVNLALQCELRVV
jgi:adenine-specific DNA-methyltransferase